MCRKRSRNNSAQLCLKNACGWLNREKRDKIDRTLKKMRPMEAKWFWKAVLGLFKVNFKIKGSV